MIYFSDFAVSSGDPHFASVVLLAGFEGTVGSQSYVDESSFARTISATGNTGANAISATSKFGGGAFRRSAGRATCVDSADWSFGSSAFTIETWGRWVTAAQGATHWLVAQWDLGNNQRSWGLAWDRTNSVFVLFISTAGSASTRKIQTAWTPTNGTWYHLAADFDGSTYRTYIDGVEQGSTGTPVTLHNSTAGMTLGASLNSGTTAGDFDGYLDEVRITKGVARYAGSFTAPTAAFPRS